MRSLESFSFFKVCEVCVTRELDADVQGRVAALKVLSRRRFVGKLAIDSVHTMKLILWEEGRENRKPCVCVCRKAAPLNGTSGT